MLQKTNYLCYAGLSLAILLGGACGANLRPVKLALPSTPVVSESQHWGVVNSNFIRLRLQPSEQSEVINGLSKGIVLRVKLALKEPGAAPEDAPRWYQVEAGEVKGWVSASQIRTCESKVEAEQLARSLQ
jgi:hypothetical protein